MHIRFICTNKKLVSAQALWAAIQHSQDQEFLMAVKNESATYRHWTAEERLFFLTKITVAMVNFQLKSIERRHPSFLTLGIQESTT